MALALRTVIKLGIDLLRGIDWRANSTLVSMIRARTGFDLAV